VLKEALQVFAERLGLEIYVVQYPPYCSKYNPIEHRLFSLITRTCQGVVFHSAASVKQFMENTKTRKGLKVNADMLTGFALRKKCAENFFWEYEDYLW